MKDELNRLLDDHQMYHSTLQMRSFILTACGGTKYAQYKQCIRELFKRKRGLQELYIAKARLNYKIDNYDSQIFEFDEDPVGFQLDEYRLQLEDLDRNIKDTEREFAFFFGTARQLKELLPELTEENRAKLDQEMWVNRLKADATQEWLGTGRVTPKTIGLLNALPDDLRKEAAKFIENKADLFKWYENEYIDRAIESFPVLTTTEDIQKLLT